MCLSVMQGQLVQAKERELGHAQQQLRQQVAIMTDINIASLRIPHSTCDIIAWTLFETSPLQSTATATIQWEREGNVQRTADEEGS